MSAELLLALAKRCEALTEPDRELDAEIACFLNDRSVQHDIVDGAVLGRSNKPPHDICIVNWAPRFTASLDAAMTLVPEGHLWIMDSWSSDAWSAGIWKSGSGCWTVNANRNRRQRTPSLALTAAALRACAALQLPVDKPL